MPKPAEATGSIAILFAVDFADALNGWAVGSSGEAVHTANGGQTWTPQATPHPPDWLYDVQFLDPDRGWAVGFDGKILATTSGGATWDAQLNSVSFVDPEHGWAVGNDGTIVRARPPASAAGDAGAWSGVVP